MRERRGSTVRRLEGLVGGSFLVYNLGHAVPLFQIGIRRPTRSHCGDCILDLGIKSPSEFHHNSLWVCVPRVCDEVLELVCVVVKGSPFLVVGSGFEAINGQGV